MIMNNLNSHFCTPRNAKKPDQGYRYDCDDEDLDETDKLSYNPRGKGKARKGNHPVRYTDLRDPDYMEQVKLNIETIEKYLEQIYPSWVASIQPATFPNPSFPRHGMYYNARRIGQVIFFVYGIKS
jgi:hypothetical protein